MCWMGGGEARGSMVSLTQQPAVAGGDPTYFWILGYTAKNPQCRSNINRSQWKGGGTQQQQYGLSGGAPLAYRIVGGAETPREKKIEMETKKVNGYKNQGEKWDKK